MELKKNEFLLATKGKIGSERRERGRRAPLVTWAASFIAFALLALAAGTEAAPAAACSGVNVPSGADLSQVAASEPSGTTFCLVGNNYTAPSTVFAQKGDRFIGTGTARAQVSGTGALNIFHADDGVVLKHLSIGGAKADEATSPDSGSGVRGGGENVRLIDVRLHHNPNSGVGGMGPNLLVSASQIDHNGFSKVYQNVNGPVVGAEGPSSAAGIKTNNSATIVGSTISYNGWNGVWCDNGAHLVVRRSKVVANAKIGISYEGCTQSSEATGNTVVGNGFARTPTVEGGMRVLAGQNFTMSGNTLSKNTRRYNGSAGFLAAGSGGDRPKLKNILFTKNQIRSDSTPGCQAPGVQCRANR